VRVRVRVDGFLRLPPLEGDTGRCRKIQGDMGEI